MSRRFGCLGPALRPNIHQVSNEAATTAVPTASRRRRTRRCGSADAAEVRMFFAAIQRILARNKKAPEAEAAGAGRYLPTCLTWLTRPTRPSSELHLHSKPQNP